MPADIVGSGKATAPTATTVLATVAAPPAGTYKIRVEATVSGNAAADTDNLKLQINNVDLSNPLPAGVSGAPVVTEFTEKLDGTHAVNVVVLANGTASILYEATLTLSLVEENNPQADAEML